MAIKEKEIVNQFMNNVWLYDKTFWKLLNFIAYDDDVEELKAILKVYGFDDIEEVFWKKFDRKSLEKQTKILFNYTGRDDNIWE